MIFMNSLITSRVLYQIWKSNLEVVLKWVSESWSPVVLTNSLLFRAGLLKTLLFDGIVVWGWKLVTCLTGGGIGILSRRC